jgi:hypothetical protein
MTLEREISPEQLDGLVSYVLGKGLGMPALFFLEMYKPVSGVLAAIGDGFHPLLKIFFGKERTAVAVQLLHDRETMERFLTLLETKMQQPQPAEEVHGS